ncbi:MAG: Na+/H+ antiporter NhaA [Saprospiraceae bacterium]|nr:Na+/H+ antiporter NhaA [Saprospiraceae bacterium]
MQQTSLFKAFFESEKAGGLILLLCTLISLIAANSSVGNYYLQGWEFEFAGHSLVHWINDGLMTIFFLLIGLELEREIYLGELSRIKDALLPTFAAIGGMAVPAGIYLFINAGSPYQSGAGIPMATDIAFALGILSLLGSRVPTSLKIFLTARAVIDDLGAIVIIALFYSDTLNVLNLALSMSIFSVLIVLNRLKFYGLLPYIIGGAFMWYFMLQSGIHATITGILLAFALPFGKGDAKSPSYILQHFLHKPVAFFILPIFAMANTAIIIHAGMKSMWTQPYSTGIALGLILGKTIGILTMAFVAFALGLSHIPADLNWKSILGVGLLGGIGFTMSIFITLLAFQDDAIINNIKIVILISSLLAGLFGYLLLRWWLPPAGASAVTP